MSAARALFGLETEFAVTAVGRDGRVLPLEPIVRQILGRAALRPHLSGTESGIFLANAARLYLDVGLHVEYAAPESMNPWDAVRYALAGDRLVAQLAAEVVGLSPGISSLLVRKSNIDYATGNTWASHENYLHRRAPHEVQPELLPHLVSRLVVTGGGGLDPLDSVRARFVLSPRASFLQYPIGSSGRGQYAIVDERDQPHCSGFYRQHLMCGDANRSHLSAFLRFGTTAIVLALIEAGHARDEDAKLVDPMAALRTVARDVTLGASLELCSGRSVTALDIQRHYLQQARAHLECLPPWGAAVCDVWQDTLDRLACGADAVGDRLDWAIKLAIYRDRAHRRGRPLAIDDATAEPDGPDVAHAPEWRAELCEVDCRFGQLYPPGLFDALDAAGVLRHGVAGVKDEDIERAISTPPTEGRARVRGALVSRLSGQHPEMSCGWDRVWDPVSLRAADLSDPFAETEVWHALAEEQCPANTLVSHLLTLPSLSASVATQYAMRRLTERLQTSGSEALTGCLGSQAVELNNHAINLRNAGRLEEAEWLMRAAVAIEMRVLPDRNLKVPHRLNNLASVLLMQRRGEEARELVARAWQHEPIRHELTGGRILTVRLALALVDGEEPTLFLGQLKTLLAMWPLPNLAQVDLQWQMRPVLDVLEPRLASEAVDLLRAIVGAMNGERPTESLAGVARWDEAPAVALEAPWPHSARVRRRDPVPVRRDAGFRVPLRRRRSRPSS